MRAQIDDLIAATRTAVSLDRDGARTAELVAGALERQLPSPDQLTHEQRTGDPARYRSHILHVEPGGSFSVVALTWRPGQTTPIHDHVTWCVFGVIQGVEYEEQFVLDDSGEYLIEAGASAAETGEVSGFAPPGDIHRVRNIGDSTAISIHIYGTDVARIGSSVRRTYDLPILSYADGMKNANMRSAAMRA